MTDSIKVFKVLLLEAYTRYSETEDWVLDPSDAEELAEYTKYEIGENKAYLKLIKYVLNNSDFLKQQLMELIPKD